MNTNSDHVLPVWAPRVRKKLIARLYESSGRHEVDEELIDEVGYALMARCKSMLDVESANDGRLPCPSCETIIAGTMEEDDEHLLCKNCGWECTWFAYKKTFQYKKMLIGGMKPFVLEFVKKFSNRMSPENRLILIDTLIHRYHWESESGSGRPGVAGLIEGKWKGIMPFLDELSYGDHVPPEAEATRAKWRKHWRGSRWEKQSRLRNE
jgi:hypothetical protein